jgi:RNA polymerase sigma-70 factor (ECF subfamily)
MGVGRGAGIVELEALYRERYRHFLRVAGLIAGDLERAHDAVQEGFAAAVRARRSYRGDGPLEAWVWRTVVNAAKRQRSSEPAAIELEPVSSNGDEAEERVIRAWIAALPERQRLAVFLRYYADLDYRSIAAVLDVEVGTVSATLSSAHANLRKVIEEVRQ